MTRYELFFFKENNRYIDVEELFRFFNYSPYISTEYQNDEVIVKYHNDNLKLDAEFHLTKASKVPDIYRLDPKYLDLDIYLSLDPLLPLFKVGIILDMVSDMCQKFNFYVYNVLFEDVSTYRKDLIIKSYELFRDAYREKNPMQYLAMNFVSRDRVNDIFKYLYERDELIKYYEHEDLYFPVVKFIKGNANGKIYTAVDFVEDKYFVFPPQTDLVFFHNGDDLKIIYCDELLSAIEKFSYDLAGFGHNTKVLDKNGIKKIVKIMSKTKFSEVYETFTNVEIESIIDFK